MMSDITHSATPYLIRGSKGIPVGVVPHIPTAHSGPSHVQPGTSLGMVGPVERKEFNPISNRSKKSSVVKATAVRKTATMKKKRGTGANTVDKLLDGTLLSKEDNTWRPLGAFMENPTESSVNHQSFMNPPRLSQEVNPVNLQGLFDDTNIREEKSQIPRKLQVFVRVRPWSTLEGNAGLNQGRACMHVANSETLAVTPPLGSMAYKHGDCQRGQTFHFSKVFEPKISQSEYYSRTAKSMVENLIQTGKGEGVFLSYGITNAGKTFTIQGTKENPGVVPLALKTLFQKIDPLDHSVEVSFCEIYNEAIFDLLKVKDGKSLKLVDGKDGLVHVSGLSWHTVKSTQDAWMTLRNGIRQRKRAETKLNYSSSRSHSVFSINLKRKNGLSSRISFVDLAGSERVGRTGTSGARFKETVSINSSLMTLGRCLESLRYNQQALKKKAPLKVIPYRESKVTHLFRDALHGFGLIMLSVNISPSPSDFDETLRVLKYAAVASHISASCPLQPIKRKLRAETPVGLRRHRVRMEQSQVALSESKTGLASESGAGTTLIHNVGVEQSVSIDSRIHGASESSPFPQILKEEEIDRNTLVSIHEDESISFDHPKSGSSLAGDGVDESPASRDQKTYSVEQDELRFEVEKLREALQNSEKRLFDMETEVREEVATEMTQIINNIEETYKQRLENEWKVAKEKYESLENEHRDKVKNLDAQIKSQQADLENLHSAIHELRDELSSNDRNLRESNEEVERYKRALNDALSEIERLHIVIEQEEATNAKLAASLSEILKEQSSSMNLGSTTPEADIKLKFKHFKREMTQIEANNAMEQEMSEHMIDRLKKDNEILKSKLSSIMHAIEVSSTPTKSAIMQNLVAPCTSGAGREAGGTPHDVALARARRACTDDNSPKSSRFAREAVLTQEEHQSADNNMLTPKSVSENAQDQNIDSNAKSRPRRSPRKKKSMTITEDEGKSENTRSRVTRRNSRDRKEDLGLGSDSELGDYLACTPNEGDCTALKSKPKRKLLSTSKPKCSKPHNGSTKILGVSNAGRRTRRGLPSASDLGFTPA